MGELCWNNCYSHSGWNRDHLSSKGTFKYEMDKVEEKDGYYLTGIHLVGGGEGARLIFTPAGVANELTGTDGSQDVLAIGQSPSDKDSHFYRN